MGIEIILAIGIWVLFAIGAAIEIRHNNNPKDTQHLR